MKFVSFCNRIIEYSFYSLFLLVPLVFSGGTSELFEFNKMWLTFGVTILIATTWFTKMIVEKRFFVQRTPLDIPLILFFASQLIATLISLDQHISWWGYYSRFNGGLLSTITYLFLYYAFVSNLYTKHVLRNISISLASGFLVALWGFPSHFGADPTCFVFRGDFDTSCWTDQFKPTIRAFSTLGQPAWMAAYFAALIPLVAAYGLRTKTATKTYLYFTLAAFFYILLIFANTRGGIIGFWIANILFWSLPGFHKLSLSKKVIQAVWFIIAALLTIWLLSKEYYLIFWLIPVIGYFLVRFFFINRTLLKPLIIFNILFFLVTIISGSPISGVRDIMSYTAPTTTTQPSPMEKAKSMPTESISGGQNITDSGNIRKLVWNGAVEAWKHSPLFGTGVETFAFAYYQYKPPAHNMTSEWDYLYNKAHNEYLNYLTTTGMFGLGTYLFFIGVFIFLFVKFLTSHHSTSKATEKSHGAHHHSVQHDKDFFAFEIVTSALFAGWISILITNFFGFSVVIMNLYLFLIPAFVLILADKLDPDRALSFGSSDSSRISHINPYQWTGIIVLFLFSLLLHWWLFSYWLADNAYALGNNLNKAGMYQDAYPKLSEAVAAEPNEPVYKDELSINLGTLATALFMQKNTTEGKQAAQQAILLSDQVTTSHPNNIVYWKNRVRLFYTLAQGDPANQQQYLVEALKAIQKAYNLSPNDAKVAYNFGVLAGQTGNITEGVKILEHTIEIKPDYTDAYRALGLFYHQMAVDDKEKVIDPALQEKAEKTYQYVLEKLSPNDKDVKQELDKWQKAGQ